MCGKRVVGLIGASESTPGPRGANAASILVGALASLTFGACGPDTATGVSTGGAGGTANGTQIPGTAGHAGTLSRGGSSPGGRTATAGGRAETTGGTANPGGGAGHGTGGALVAECGNGVAEVAEQCDGEDFGETTCRSLGFDEGVLECRDCAVDFSDCSGDESPVAACFDFRDNDGDRKIDCADEECTETCSAPCANAPDIPDPAVIQGTTVGRGALVEPSCNANGATTGPEVVFQMTAGHTGIIEASVASSENLTVSLRTSCEDLASELGCAVGTSLKEEITAGQTVFVIVDGFEASTAGAFTLEVASRTIECGDGHRDGEEECDDGNTDDDDGCSATCIVQPAETEDNGSLADANTYVEPFFASIADPNDEDWVAFSVAAAPGSVTIDTFDFGDGACAGQELDSALELYDAAGNHLGDNDDGGVGLCAHLSAGDLSTGTYYVRVFASPFGRTGTFPYHLAIDVDSCGNGRQSESEECDDGNRTAWDGCDPDCKSE